MSLGEPRPPIPSLQLQAYDGGVFSQVGSSGRQTQLLTPEGPLWVPTALCTPPDAPDTTRPTQLLRSTAAWTQGNTQHPFHSCPVMALGRRMTDVRFVGVWNASEAWCMGTLRNPEMKYLLYTLNRTTDWSVTFPRLMDVVRDGIFEPDHPLPPHDPLVLPHWSDLNPQAGCVQ